MTNTDSNTTQAPIGRRVSLTEDKLDPVELAKVQLGTEPGQIAGVRFSSVMECMQVAKMMAISDVAVPPYLRGNRGACLAIVMRSVVLGIEPFALANWSYEVDNRGVKSIAYMAALYHAVVELRAPIRGGVHHEILGEGEERYCRVWVVRRDTGETIEFKGGTLAELRPALNNYGQVKGSQLWTRKPNVQLFYDAVRDLARTRFPHIVAGLPLVEDIMDFQGEHVGPDNAKDVTTSTLGERLRARQVATAAREGFSDQTIHEHIEAAVAAATPKQDAPAEPTTRSNIKLTIDETAVEVVPATATTEKA